VIYRASIPLVVPPPDDPPSDTLGVIPASFTLYQNYPNPFNPKTTIWYDVPELSKVSIRIFDLLGRQVAVLVDEVQNAGMKSVEWNAAGRASGLYFCTIEAASSGQPRFRETKKMLLIR
jgi:hypothetical protein